MTDPKYLNKDDILAFGLRVEELPIPEWGGRIVLIKEPSALQTQKDSEAMVRGNGKVDYEQAMKLPTKMCVRQVVGEDGKRLFSDKEIAKLHQSSAAFVTRVAEKVREMSLQGKDHDKAAISDWLKENHPKILKEFQEETGAVGKAKANFI